MRFLLVAVVILAVWLATRDAWQRRKTERVREFAAPSAPPPTWVARLSTGELAELCLRLLPRLGYAMLAQTVEGDRAEITAVDGSFTGGRRLLVSAHAYAAGPVPRLELRRSIEHARAEGCSRILVVGVAGFGAEAEHAAQTLPVELLDGADLAALTESYLPELHREPRNVALDTRGAPPHLPAPA